MPTNGYQTMRLQGKIKNQLVIFLVDTWSTHNFMDYGMIKRVKGTLQPIVSLTVIVAKGEHFKAQKICSGLP